MVSAAGKACASWYVFEGGGLVLWRVPKRSWWLADVNSDYTDELGARSGEPADTCAVCAPLQFFFDFESLLFSSPLLGSSSQLWWHCTFPRGAG